MRIFLRAQLLIRALFLKLANGIIIPLPITLIHLTANGHNYTQRGILVFPRYITNDDKMFFPGWYHLRPSGRVTRCSQ